MTTRKTDQKQGSEAAAVTMPVDATMAGMQTRMAQMMTGNAELARRWMDGWARMMTELLDFSGRRMQANFETLERTARCQDPGEALRMQMSSVETAVRVYADEAGRLYELCSKTSEDCIKAFDGAHDETTQAPRPEPRQAAE
ncbi:phasin family protein [Rhodovibrio sodomensis]|nr:phasin family protein [Rhodovibrio sodomensis]